MKQGRRKETTKGSIEGMSLGAISSLKGEKIGDSKMKLMKDSLKSRHKDEGWEGKDIFKIRGRNMLTVKSDSGK